MNNRSLKILILEDSKAQAAIIIDEMHRLKGQCRLTIDHVERLSEALDRLGKNQYDLVLTDMEVLDSAHLDTPRAIIGAAPSVPVVVMTATYLDERLGIEAIKFGAQDYLFKDEISGPLLMRVIRHAIERKAAERKAEEETSVRAEFIAMVSHELRTPMTVIKEGIGMVADGTLGPVAPDQAEYLEVAQRNVDRLARLINDVLDFQKLELGRSGADRSPQSMNALILENLPSLTLVASQRGLTLKTELAEGLPTRKVNKDQMTQTLMNLVSNASKFTEKGGITIKTESRGGVVKVSVIDTGIGIKPEDLDKLFKQFSQIRQEGVPKKIGTGLGLVICKGIVEQHGGMIGVESEWGRGTTFYFTLPQPGEIKG